jgi:rubrerythrin
MRVVPGWQSSEGKRSSLRELRDDSGADQTLQNLLRALTLNLELRARYRVFEFEATQDGLPEIARLFRELRQEEGHQITELMAGLHDRLGEACAARPADLP